MLHENALVFSQSEVRNFSMYIITRVIQPIIFQSYWSCNGFWKDQHVEKCLECFFGVIITFVFNCRSVLFLMPCISLHHLDLFWGMTLWVWSRSGRTMDLSCIERLYPSVVLQQTWESLDYGTEELCLWTRYVIQKLLIHNFSVMHSFENAS